MKIIKTEKYRKAASYWDDNTRPNLQPDEPSISPHDGDSESDIESLWEDKKTNRKMRSKQTENDDADDE